MACVDETTTIYESTAEQALRDGLLHEPFPERWPKLFITPNVYAACDNDDAGRTYEKALTPLLMDAIVSSQHNIRSQRPEWPVVLEHTVAGDVWVMPNEFGGLTVMTPAEY